MQSRIAGNSVVVLIHPSADIPLGELRAGQIPISDQDEGHKRLPSIQIAPQFTQDERAKRGARKSL